MYVLPFAYSAGVAADTVALVENKSSGFQLKDRFDHRIRSLGPVMEVNFSCLSTQRPSPMTRFRQVISLLPNIPTESIHIEIASN